MAVIDYDYVKEELKKMYIKMVAILRREKHWPTIDLYGL